MIAETVIKVKRKTDSQNSLGRISQIVARRKKVYLILQGVEEQKIISSLKMNAKKLVFLV